MIGFKDYRSLTQTAFTGVLVLTFIFFHSREPAMQRFSVVFDRTNEMAHEAHCLGQKQRPLVTRLRPGLPQ
jgi:hypothetical protein